MKKEEEIKVLQSLKGDTYFNQYFSNEDIDQMCQNISNDFAIENGCPFLEKEQKRLAHLRNVVETKNRHIENLAYAIIDHYQGQVPDGVYGSMVQSLGIAKRTGMLTIIRYKRQQGYALTESELNFLIDAASREY